MASRFQLGRVLINRHVRLAPRSGRKADIGKPPLSESCAVWNTAVGFSSNAIFLLRQPIGGNYSRLSRFFGMGCGRLGPYVGAHDQSLGTLRPHRHVHRGGGHHRRADGLVDREG